MRWVNSAESWRRRCASTLDAGALHLGDHGRERAVEGLVDRDHALLEQARAQMPPQAQRDLGVLGGVGGGLVDRDGGEADLGRTLAAQALVGDAVMVEEALGELVHAVAVAGAAQHVGEQHGVVAGGHLEPVMGEDAGVVLDVVADLEHRRVGEHGPQALDHGHQLELAVERGWPNSSTWAMGT